MPKLIVLVGPPGSGKSTFAYNVIMDNSDAGQTDVYINQDIQKKDHLRLFQEAIKNREELIIVDRMNFNKQQRARYLEPAKKAGYQTQIVVLHQNYETCLKRCNERNDHPTIRNEEDARSALNMFFGKYERPTQDEADNIIFHYPEQNLKLTTIICDIDNTLSSADHREHFLQGEKKNWKGFFDAMDKDPLNVWCAKLLRNMRTNHIITLLSGRPDNFRKVTKDWLQENKVFYDNLYMRPRNDSRSDTIIKEILLDFEVLTRYSEVLFVVDDRKCVIEMWRKRGLVVLDCAGPKGDF